MKSCIGLSFEAIGKAIGRDEMFVASVFYGQAKPTAEDIKVCAFILWCLTNDRLAFHVTYDSYSGLIERTRGIF